MRTMQDKLDEAPHWIQRRICGKTWSEIGFYVRICESKMLNFNCIYMRASAYTVWLLCINLISNFYRLLLAHFSTNQLSMLSLTGTISFIETTLILALLLALQRYIKIPLINYSIILNSPNLFGFSLRIWEINLSDNELIKFLWFLLERVKNIEWLRFMKQSNNNINFLFKDFNDYDKHE